MPDISSAPDAERTRRLQRKIKDNLTSSFHRLALTNPLGVEGGPSSTPTPEASMEAKGKPKTSAAQPQPTHLASGTNGYTQRRSDADTSSDADAAAHLAAQQSALAGSHSSANAPGSFQPKVEQLSYSNYTFWYMSVRLASALYRCEEHVISDPPAPADADGQDTHRRSAAQAWLIITQSVPEDIRHQLTIDDLSSTPNAICEKLKEVVIARPENSRVFLMSRAQNTILRTGDSMSDYLNAHDDIRQRMILVDHIKEDDEATTILFILCGLRQNPDYAEVYSALSIKSASSSLTLAALKHDLLREEQYLKTKGGHTYPSTNSRAVEGTKDGRTSQTESGSGSNGNGTGNGASGSGMWCSFHEVHTHNTDQCQAKARHEAMAHKWCSFHETNTHDTTECKAKARQETMGSKWCAFHESHSHNTDECEAKRRQEDYSTKWCSFHESHTHNTDECQAKAKQDALYPR